MLLLSFDDLHVLDDGEALLGRLRWRRSNDHILVLEFLHERVAVSVLGGLGWLLSCLRLQPFDPLGKLGVLASHPGKLLVFLRQLCPDLFYRRFVLCLHSFNFGGLLFLHLVFLELVLVSMRLKLFLLSSEVHLDFFHPSLQVLLLFFSLSDEFLVRDLHRLDLGLPVGEVLVVS